MEELKANNSPEEEELPNNELLNTPSTGELIIPASETIPEAALPSALNPQPSTVEDMEVHHHPHDPAAPHHKKNWKSYFWEFLMLFLAVFCGFLAEYQLEQTIERHREKEYATLLIKDLEKDTIQISDSFKQWEKILESIDTVSSVVYKGVSGNKVQGSFYYHSQMGTISPITVWNDATLIQLTQSGNLRYFRNQELVNKISSYYSSQSYIRSLNNGDRERREITIAIRSRILNNHYYKYYSKVLPSDSLPFPDSLMKNMIPIQNSDPQLLNAYLRAIENFNPRINQQFGAVVDPHQWIPQGLPYDLIDNRNDAALGGFIIDNVSGYTTQQCFNALQSDVRTIPTFRDRLLQQNGNNQIVNVNDLFFRYGY